jgi:hypothetical protein
VDHWRHHANGDAVTPMPASLCDDRVHVIYVGLAAVVAISIAWLVRETT